MAPIQKRKDYRTVARVRHHKQVAVALQPYLAQVLANGNTLGTRLVAAEVVVAGAAVAVVVAEVRAFF